MDWKRPWLGIGHKRDMRVSVIMPVYSEVETIGRVAHGALAELGASGHELLFIVSPRSSPESRAACEAVCAQEPRARLLMQSDRAGFGWAYREAFPQATGDAILMLDSDGEFQIETIPKLLTLLEAGADMAVANRWAAGGGAVGYGWQSWAANRLFGFVLRLWFRTPLRDLTYGYKLLRRSVAENLVWEGERHEFAMETTLRPLRAGYVVRDAPSVWRRRTSGVSKNSTIRVRLPRYLALAGRIHRDQTPFH